MSTACGLTVFCSCRYCSTLLKNRSRRLFSRSEEHTSELQSQSNLVCRLLLEKKNKDVYAISLFTTWSFWLSRHDCPCMWLAYVASFLYAFGCISSPLYVLLSSSPSPADGPCH